MAELLKVSDISVRYGNLQILKDVSFSLEEGQWLMIIGPNGAGKSTIVNAIAQGVPYTGSVFYMGQDIKKYRPHELARKIGILSQNHYVGYSFKVNEVVRLGRYAYSGGLFGRHDDRGEDQIERALALTGLTKMADRSVLELSGGELQRVFLAQLFAQDPQILILDEPTNHLDLVYQKQTFSLISQWLKEEGRAVISVVHDLSLARAYGSHALLLQNGNVIISGRTSETFSPKYLEQAFSIDVYDWMRTMLGQWEQPPAME